MTDDSPGALDYHLRELEIATTSAHVLKSLPTIPSNVKRVLDVGCGIGQSLIGLKLGPDVEAHGVDVDRSAIAFGKARFPQLQLLVGKGEQLPYAECHFDLLMCRVALPYMHVPSALREFHRVLRDGGVLWLAIHPLSMLTSDVREAIRCRSVRGVVFRTYVLANSLLLLSGRQFRYPLNRARIESYQWRPALRASLQKAGFELPRSRQLQGSLVVATKTST
jgi:ubiquinone/menaquinone biosynthesis C-methylase UbiE